MDGARVIKMKLSTLLMIICGIALSQRAVAQETIASAKALPNEVVGRYSCLTNDKTELSMGNRSSGHKYHDLDGDTSDPAVSVAMEIGGDQSIKLQSVFAGEAGRLEQYKVLASFQYGSGETDLKSYQIVAISTDGNSWVPRKLVQFHATESHQTIGVMTSTLSSSKPAMRNGEKFAISDIELMLCTKAK